MKKLEAVIRPERLQAVQDRLDQLGASGLTVSEVLGCGQQRGYTESYRGTRAAISLLPKLKLECVLPDDLVEPALAAIEAAAATGETGDGRVFVLEVQAALRIRTGERGEFTLRHAQPEGWGRDG